MIRFSLYVGWFLLPNTPLAKNAHFMLFVNFGRLLAPPKTHFCLLDSILSEPWETATVDFQGNLG